LVGKSVVRRMFDVLYLLLLCCCCCSSCSGLDFDFRRRGDALAVEDLACRILGDEVRGRVRVRVDADRYGGEFGGFEVCTTGTILQIGAASGPDAGYGLSTYLREVYLMSFSWNRTGGHQLNNFQAKSFPKLLSKCIRRDREVQISYMNNVVTFSYSYVWYTFREWEYLLDWMALSGINLAIAYTGQEETYRKTFNTFNISNDEFSSWCNSIGYLAWSRGQNLHGCGGGLPLDVMRHQWDLQKLILRRMRALGIVPVLPAFQGNMPSQMRKLFPNANISQRGVAWLDATDPLFQEIQRRFLQILREDFGSDSWYETDGYFNHAAEPWTANENEKCRYNVAIEDRNSSKPFSYQDGFSHSSAVYKSLKAVDSDAFWLYQGWIWRDWDKDRFDYMKGFIQGVENHRLVILDMFDEVSPEWDKFDDFGYFDNPFIWSTLHNFGGNTGIWGSLALLQREPRRAQKACPGGFTGIGAAPEGIDHNPVYYTLLFDMAWKMEKNLNEYVETYADQRYGKVNEAARTAWKLLARDDGPYGDSANLQIAYRKHWLSEKNADGITACPTGGVINTPGENCWYNLERLESALKLLKNATSALPWSRALNFDLVNMERELLAKQSNPEFLTMINESLPTPVRVQAGKRILEFQRKVDNLLNTEPSFSAQEIFEMAKRLAFEIDSSGKHVSSFVLQAKAQTTTWAIQSFSSTTSQPDSTNMDYANKQWSFQIAHFYLPRTSCFIQFIHDINQFHDCVLQVTKAYYSATKVNFLTKA